MKKILLLLFVASICLFGCLNSKEDITINAGGSGVYKNTMDMSGFLMMMPLPASTDSLENIELQKASDKIIDTIILFKSFVDTVTSLTSEQKRLIEKASMRLNLNQSEKLFKATVSYPFAGIEDLQKIMELQQANKLPNPLKKSINGDEAIANNARLPMLDKILNTTLTTGLIERKIDHEKLNELKDNEQFNEMSEGKALLETVTFNSSFHLPRPAKTVSGEKLKLSNDKKTITVNYTLMDVIRTPSSLEFKVEY